MDEGPLVTEQIESGLRFVRAFESRIPLQAAFWLKECDDGMWYLYLTSDQIDESNIYATYGEVIRVVNDLQDPNFDGFQVKVVSGKSAVAKAAISMLESYPSKHATRYRGRRFGDLIVDEVYIYPRQVAAGAS